jgi:alpha-tubulin suppressor-like RCC1 family protein
MRSWIVVAWVVVAVAGCGGPSRVVGVTCSAEGDCAVDGIAGQCEATGFCSYPDATCASGQRYSPAATGGLSNTCVAGGACGGPDQPCCNGTVCGAHLACSLPERTCTCGGDGQPCCDGATCGDGFGCTASGLCACGGIGEPCCGGATCDTGLTCSAGACTGGVLQVAVGAFHVCALRTDRTVWCWGTDAKPYPQGNPSFGIPVLSGPTPEPIPGLVDVEELRAGEFHTCARTADKTLWCWGHNERGQLGNGTRTSSLAPVQVAGLTGVSQFDGGRHHTCAIGSVGGVAGVWCWGGNGQGGHRQGRVPAANLGRLGNDSLVDSSVPVRVQLAAATSAGQTVRSLSTGSFHSCVVMSDSRVWCWGRGSHGALGNGATSHTKLPVLVDVTAIAFPPGVTIDEVACTDGYDPDSTCMRLSNGAAYCWGAGGLGQLGDDTTTTARSAPTTPVERAGAVLVELAAGKASLCARAATGTVWCWGQNQNGVLGNDQGNGAYPLPVQAVNLSGVIQLDVSHRTACAVDGSQRLFCWGSNRHGHITASHPRSDAEGRVRVPTQVNL